MVVGRGHVVGADELMRVDRLPDLGASLLHLGFSAWNVPARYGRVSFGPMASHEPALHAQVRITSLKYICFSCLTSFIPFTSGKNYSSKI